MTAPVVELGATAAERLGLDARLKAEGLVDDEEEWVFQAAPLVRTVWPGSQIFASRWLATGRARQTNNWQPRGR